MNYDELLALLEKRFNRDKEYHPGFLWSDVKKYLAADKSVLDTVLAMEETGGEPAFVLLPNNIFSIIDLTKESPRPRRSLCYDEEALAQRKVAKPLGSATSFAAKIGANLVSEEVYLYLQKRFNLDKKSSTWLSTPPLNRALGGALYGERKFNKVIIGANSAESYFSSRGIRLIVLLGDN